MVAKCHLSAVLEANELLNVLLNHSLSCFPEADTGVLLLSPFFLSYGFSVYSMQFPIVSCKDMKN